MDVEKQEAAKTKINLLGKEQLFDTLGQGNDLGKGRR